MNREEIKNRIIGILNEFPDPLLEEVLAYVKQKQETFSEPSDDDLLEKILREDKELLQKLAQ